MNSNRQDISFSEHLASTKLPVMNRFEHGSQHKIDLTGAQRPQKHFGLPTSVYECNEHHGVSITRSQMHAQL